MRAILDCYKNRRILSSVVTKFLPVSSQSVYLHQNKITSLFLGIYQSLVSLQRNGRMNYSSSIDIELETQACSLLNIEEDLKPASEALTELINSKKASNLVIEKKALVFCDTYRALKHEQKSPILSHLAHFWSSQQNVTLLFAKKYITAQEKGEEALIKAEDQLRSSLAADQGWILSSLARIEGGIRFLIEIRSDILDLINTGSDNTVALKSLSNGIRDLIAPCFGVDLLHLERVTWFSPGNLLQKVSEGEAVHPVRSWYDLKRRLGLYRRCFILTHPAIPLQPLAILHVALTSEISSSIHSIITRSSGSLTSEVSTESEIAHPVTETEDLTQITTAIFYSISSTQKGLTGIDLGQGLIKRAVRQLMNEVPSIRQFSTLSPIPGFRSWLIHLLREAEKGRETILSNKDWFDFQPIFDLRGDQIWPELRQLLVDNSWTKDDSKVKLLEWPLMRLCAHYLVHEKRRGFALDSVANFHLRNGALVWRLNWMADTSPRGMKNAFGIMANYRYILEDSETFSQEYVEKQHMEISDQVRQLLAKSSVTNNLSRL